MSPKSQATKQIPASLDHRPIVVIVGRPNVGKSTLFNRLIGRRVAIVTEIAGTTRDRIAMDVPDVQKPFVLMDTAGMEASPTGELDAKVQQHIGYAISEADLVLFVVDSRAGLIPVDTEMARVVRKTGKPVLLVANKTETAKEEAQAQEFHRLGFGDPILISAYHNQGMADLLWKIDDILPPSAPESEKLDNVLRLAIVGRPNVGKSSLLNAILGHERSIVSAKPGTTRDAIDTPFQYKDQEMLLIDTAGIRRKGQQMDIIERFSLLRSMQAISRADIAMLVLDAQEMATDQDAHVAGYILEEYKGVIVVVNKWDLSRQLGITPNSAKDFIRERLKFMPYVPIVFISALTGKGVNELLPLAIEIYNERQKRIGPDQLRTIMLEAFGAHPPATIKGKRLSISSVSQSKTSPPTFDFQVNNPDLAHFSYQRFLENSIREAHKFHGTPIKMIFRKQIT